MHHSMTCLATGKQNRTVRKQRLKCANRQADQRKSVQNGDKKHLDDCYGEFTLICRARKLRIDFQRTAEVFGNTKFHFLKKSKGLFQRNLANSFSSICRRNLCLGDPQKAKDVEFQLCKVLFQSFSHNFGVLSI